MKPLVIALDRRFARNTILNFGGQLIQLAAAIAALPLLVRGLGTEAFGAFQLVWVALGYFALVDLGLGRATTRYVADALGREAREEVGPIVASALLTQLAFATAGALLLAAAVPTLVERFIQIPAELVAPTERSFRLLAIGLPAVVATACLSGVLEAYQRFDLVNAVRVPIGVAALLAPVVAVAFGHQLAGAVISVVVVRITGVLLWGVTCYAAVPDVRRGLRLQRNWVRTLLAFGGWLTVSNVISPLMTYLDRFIVGHLLGLTAVAWYSAPYDGVSRLAIVPWSIATTLFPAFSGLRGAAALPRLRGIYARAVLVLAMLMTPLCLLLMVAARPLLTVWLGAEFSGHATLPLQILTAGMFANAVAQMPFALLQGLGRADITARLHLLELAPYGVLVWNLTLRWGVTGTAIAWTARATVDAFLLFLAARLVLRAPNAPTKNE